jgi:hypothetical protein
MTQRPGPASLEAPALSLETEAARLEADLKTLHAKIGRLALENDFMEGALSKAGLLSAKR